MNVTRLAIEKNRLTLLAVVLVVAAGVATFRSMPRAYDPGFVIRSAQVLSYFPGAGPERVEQLVTSKLEEAYKAIAEIDYIKSESRTGVSIVTVNVQERYSVMRPIWAELRRKTADVAPDLPEGTLGPYVNDDFGDVFGIVLTITGEGIDGAEMNEVAETVRDELQRLPDAAKVEIHGAQDERVFVEYDNASLAELGLSPHQLSEALEARNVVVSGGSFSLGPERIVLEPSGSFESMADIGRTILRIPGTRRLVHLADVATVSRGYVDPPSSLLRSSGRRALGVAIAMREGGNNILLGEQVRTAVTRFVDAYPHGIEFDLVTFSPAEVEEKVDAFVLSLLQAVGVVTAVMLLTLGLRTGLVVASLIPLAMLLALVLMSALSVHAQASGEAVPLRQVAEVYLAWEPARIHRRDGVRTVTVGAQLAPGVTAAEKFEELRPWLEARRAEWEPAVRYELGGELETSGKANRSIVEKLPVAAMVILTVLVAQFNSFRKTAIVLATIPLGLIGVVAGLLATGSFFGFMTLLGIVSLAGIVINNAIVLLESIEAEREGGTPPSRAIVAAAQARARARPILLTTATTVLRMLPLYLGGGEMWEPLAVAIMAGLIFSTVLSLGVVPVLYAVLYGIRA